MSHEVRCIIIDDELKAIDLLKERLKVLFPGLKVAGTYTDWKSGYDAVRNTEIDILFLDISMPEKSGVDFIKLFPGVPFQVIFITAHSEFALDAIKLSAAGYVLKPIDDHELSFAVNKAIEKIKGKLHTLPSNPGVPSSVKIGVPNIKGVDYLNPEDVLYFESVNKYTKVVTKDYSIMSSYNLGEFKKVIDFTVFFQVHRSYIVNLYHIKRYESSGMLIMDDNMQIPVARSVRTDFTNVFTKIGKVANAAGRG